MRMTAHQLALHRLKTGRRPVEREADLHAMIAAELKARRIYFVHSRMDKAATNGIGTTDFIIALPGGTTLWIEAKTAKGKLSREQSSVALLLNIARHHHFVVRSMPEFLETLNAFPAAVTTSRHLAGDTRSISESK